MSKKEVPKIDLSYYKSVKAITEDMQSIYVILRADNYGQERKKFLKDKKTCPKFRYSTIIPNKCDEIKKRLNLVKKDLQGEKNPLLKKLYQDRIHELEDQLAIRLSIGTDSAAFHKTSKKLYGAPKEKDFKIALREYREEREAQKSEKEEDVQEFKAKDIKEVFNRAIEELKIPNWRATVVPSILSIYSNSEHRLGPRLEVPVDREVALYKLEELVQHEIVVHILRGESGKLSKIALIGFLGADHYATTEEGLATYSEQRIAKKRGRRPKNAGVYGAIAVGAAMEGRNFSQTYQFLERLGFSEYDTWKYTYRIFRGLSDTSKNNGEVCTIDWLYRTGNRIIWDFVRKKGELALDHLWVGKIGIHHLDLVSRLGIKKPAISPRFLKIEELL